MKKNILVVMTTPLDRSGISFVIMNYYSRLDKEKFNIYISIFNNPTPELYEEFERKVGKIIKLHNRNKSFYKYYKGIIETIKKHNIDIMHVHGNSSTMLLEMYAGYKANVCFRIAHGHNTSTKSKFMNAILNKLFLKYCTHRLTCSTLAGNWLYKRNEFKVIKNAIDITQYKFNLQYSLEIREEFNLSDKKIIGMVGRLSEVKNHIYIMEMMKELISRNPKLILLIVGDGNLHNNYKEYIEKNDLNNHIILAGKRNDVYKFYSAFDLYLHPSIYEGFPLTIVEAISSGLNCLISNKVSKEVLLVDGIKFLEIDNDNKSDWVYEILDNIYEYDRENTSKNNIEKLRELGFDIDMESKTLEQLYETMN